MQGEIGAQKALEAQEIEARKKFLKQEIAVLAEKLAKKQGELGGLCHNSKRNLQNRYSAQKLKAGGVSVRCEECGERFRARIKSARFCKPCIQKRRRASYQLVQGSFHG